jgi:hypothetical protein
MTFSFRFGDRLIRAPSFYPEQRISSFEGLQKAKAGIGRYLRSILDFKFEEPIRMDGILLLRATEGQVGG